MDGSPTRTWRAVFDKHYSALVDEVSSRLDSQLEESVARVTAAERDKAEPRQIGERTPGHSGSPESDLAADAAGASQIAVLELLADGTSPWAGKMVVLSFENNQARVLAVRELNEDELNQRSRSFELDRPARFAPRSIPKIRWSRWRPPGQRYRQPWQMLLGRRRDTAGKKASEKRAGESVSFPAVARQTVVAMLIASGSVASAPLEVLSEAAGMKLELLSAPRL